MIDAFKAQVNFIGKQLLHLHCGDGALTIQFAMAGASIVDGVDSDVKAAIGRTIEFPNVHFFPSTSVADFLRECGTYDVVVSPPTDHRTMQLIAGTIDGPMDVATVVIDGKVFVVCSKRGHA